MISGFVQMGLRLGFYDTLVKTNRGDGVTSKELALATGKSERYVCRCAAVCMFECVACVQCNSVLSDLPSACSCDGISCTTYVHHSALRKTWCQHSDSIVRAPQCINHHIVRILPTDAQNLRTCTLGSGHTTLSGGCASGWPHRPQPVCSSGPTHPMVRCGTVLLQRCARYCWTTSLPTTREASWPCPSLCLLHCQLQRRASLLVLGMWCRFLV